MEASLSTAVPFAQEDNGLLLLAVVIYIVHGVKDSTTQYEDRCELVDALGTALNAP
jgi:hypothetical protein